MSSPGEKGASGEIREANLRELLHYKYLLGLVMREAPQRELTYGKMHTNRTKIWSWKGGKSPLRKPCHGSKQTEAALGKELCGDVKNKAGHRINKE